VAHDGSEGLSPDGWLPDRISIGVLTRVFTPGLVDAAVDAAGAREQRRRLLPARLVMYFVLALWLFRGRNCGYGQVMTKLADGLYHQRRSCDLLDGQLDVDGWVDAGGRRRWKPPNISSLSRGRGKLGPAPVRFLFEQVAGPTGDLDAAGVSCCGLRVVSVDGSTSDVPDSAPNDEHFGRPSNQTRDGAFPQIRWLAAAESGTGSLLGASMGPYRDSEQALARDLLEQECFGPGMLVLADRKFLSWALAREFLATGAHILWRASAAFTLKPVKVLEDGTYLARLTPPRKKDGPPLTVRVIEYTVHTTPEDGGEAETSELFCLVTDLLDPGVPGPGSRVLLPAAVGLRDRHRAPQDRHGRRAAGAAQQGPGRRRAGNVGAVRRLPGNLQDHRDRGGCRWHPPGQDQLPARPGRRDRHRHGLFPLSRPISRSPRSCSRSSPRAHSPATARTGPAPARQRNPATSPPASPVSRASPMSSGKSSSTCSART
jgi:Insertion element 4 transposase N-terminal